MTDPMSLRMVDIGDSQGRHGAIVMATEGRLFQALCQDLD